MGTCGDPAAKATRSGETRAKAGSSRPQPQPRGPVEVYVSATKQKGKKALESGKKTVK